jgi:hypothetical protein
MHEPKCGSLVRPGERNAPKLKSDR